jgi:hypothetical protein
MGVKLQELAASGIGQDSTALLIVAWKVARLAIDETLPEGLIFFREERGNRIEQSKRYGGVR